MQELSLDIIVAKGSHTENKPVSVWFLPWPLPERQAMVMWPPIQDVTNRFKSTDKNRHVCKACNWSRVLDCLMTVS